MVYFDTSILVAYYVPEALSAQADARLRQASIVAISELTHTEFVSALALRHRRVELSLSDAQQIAALFAKHLAEDLYQSVPLSAGVYRLARDYIARFDLPLKAPDALHLAVAATERLPLVTADRQLARNAEALGITMELLEPPADSSSPA